MGTKRILIHGSTAARMGTVPALGQIGSDDDLGAVVVGNGVTAGGIVMARADHVHTAEAILYDNAASGLDAATVQAALDELAGGAGGGGGMNDALFALEIADLKGVRLGMKGGIADPFDDETGVNAAESSGQSYDPIADQFSPSGVPTTAYSKTLTQSAGVATQRKYRGRIAPAVITASGPAVRVKLKGPASGSPKTISNVFLGQAATSGDAWDMLATGPAPVRMTFGFANSVTPPVGGEIWSDWINFPLDNTKTHIIAYDTVATTGNLAYDTSTANEDSWYKDGATDEASSPNVAGYSTTGNVFFLAEIQVLAGVSDMVLKSIPYNAGAVPSKGRLAVQVLETDTIAINTDLIAKLSRDGGTTWETAELALVATPAGPKMYEASDIDLSTLPSGASMRWEVDTANNKLVAISGVVMQWSEG